MNKPHQVPLGKLSIDNAANPRQDAAGAADATPSIMFRQGDDGTIAIVDGNMRANAMAALGRDVHAVGSNGRHCTLRRTPAGDWIEV